MISALDLSFTYYNFRMTDPDVAAGSGANAPQTMMFTAADLSTADAPAPTPLSGGTNDRVAAIVPTGGHDPDAPSRFFESADGWVQPLPMSASGGLGGVLQAPGESHQTAIITTDWFFRQAGYGNDLVLYTVDDAYGRINGVAPGDDGYDNYAAARAQMTLDSPDGGDMFTLPSDSPKSIALAGGTYFSYYVIQGSNGHSPGMGWRWFPFEQANPDGYLHFQSIGAGNSDASWYNHLTGTELASFRVEDLSPTLANPGNLANDADFDDVVFSVSATVGDLDIIKPGGAAIDEELEESPGGYVGVNSGELVPLVLRAAQSSAMDGEYRLHFNSNKIKLWRHPNRTGEVISSITPFDPANGATVYVEGLEASLNLMAEVVSLRWYSQGGTSYELDSVALTAVDVDVESLAGTVVPVSGTTALKLEPKLGNSQEGWPSGTKLKLNVSSGSQVRIWDSASRTTNLDPDGDGIIEWYSAGSYPAFVWIEPLAADTVNLTLSLELPNGFTIDDTLQLNAVEVGVSVSRATLNTNPVNHQDTQVTSSTASITYVQREPITITVNVPEGIDYSGLYVELEVPFGINVYDAPVSGANLTNLPIAVDGALFEKTLFIDPGMLEGTFDIVARLRWNDPFVGELSNAWGAAQVKWESAKIDFVELFDEKAPVLARDFTVDRTAEAIDSGFFNDLRSELQNRQAALDSQDPQYQDHFANYTEALSRLNQWRDNAANTAGELVFDVVKEDVTLYLGSILGVDDERPIDEAFDGLLFDSAPISSESSLQFNIEPRNVIDLIQSDEVQSALDGVRNGNFGGLEQFAKDPSNYIESVGIAMELQTTSGAIIPVTLGISSLNDVSDWSKNTYEAGFVLRQQDWSYMTQDLSFRMWFTPEQGLGGVNFQLSGGFQY